MISIPLPRNPAAICIAHPGFPVTTMSGFTERIALAFSDRTRAASSGWTGL